MPSGSFSEVPIPRAMSLNLDANEEILHGQGRSSGRKFGRQHSCAVACDMKVVVAWLENLDDYVSFPLGKYCLCITIHTSRRVLLPLPGF